MADEAKSEWTAGRPAGGIASVNVTDGIARLKRGPQWAAGDRVAETLAKNSELSVTLSGASSETCASARGTISTCALPAAPAFTLRGPWVESIR